MSRFVKDGGRLTFLHVIRDSGRRHFGRAGAPEHSSAKVLDAGRQLHSLLDAQGSEAEVCVSVSANAVHEEVLRVASERNADLIVLGATRHAGLRRRFLGSTAIRVSRRSPLPVFVLPATLGKRELSPLDEAVLGWAA